MQVEDICGVKRWWKRGSEAEVEELWTALLSRQGCRKWKKSCLWLEVQHAGAYGLRCVGLEAAPWSFGVVRWQLLRVGSIEGQPCNKVLHHGCPTGSYAGDLSARTWVHRAKWIVEQNGCG